MPNHNIFKAAQFSWRLQNPDRWIVSLIYSETLRYRGYESCSGYAPNGGGRIRYSDDYPTFVAFRAEALFRSEPRAGHATDADVLCLEIFFDCQPPRISAFRCDHADQLLFVDNLTLQLGWRVGVVRAQQQIKTTTCEVLETAIAQGGKFEEYLLR